MQRLPIFALAAAAVGAVSADAQQSVGNVTILESQVNNVAYDMDAEWLNVATSMGYSASIQPQSILASTAFFSSTDILIVASGTLPISPPEVSMLQAFLLQGGQLYLQGEHLSFFSTNQGFRTLVLNLGGYFSFTGSTSGDLQPMSISGSIASTPNAVPTLNRHWYGAYGYASSGVIPFMHHNGRSYGWIFATPGGGKIIHTTDQEWVRESANPQLQENILANLTVDGLRISIDPQILQSGSNATLIVHGATPSGTVIAAYSLTGPGPSNTLYGPVDLSPPIHTMPILTADNGGMASHARMVPQAIGMTVWIQAVETQSGEISNLLVEVIQ